MTTKHLNKKNNIRPHNIRQKRLIKSINVTNVTSEAKGFSYNENSLKGTEAAIIRQFNLIQKDYSKLMNDVMKELDLLKGWIETQAVSRSNALKTRLSSRLGS